MSALTEIFRTQPDDNVRRHIGAYGGQLTILGCGHNVWDDIDRFPGRRNGHILCVHDIATHFPEQIHHMHSNYGHMIDHWAQIRGWRFVNTGFLHCCSPIGYPSPPHVARWPVPSKGSSSLTATLIGLLMGYAPIVLAGVPLDDGGHYYDRPHTVENQLGVCEKWWVQARDIYFEGRVKSLSGKTRDILGAP